MSRLSAAEISDLLKEMQALRADNRELRSDNRELRSDNRVLRSNDEDLRSQNEDLKTRLHSFFTEPLTADGTKALFLNPTISLTLDDVVRFSFGMPTDSYIACTYDKYAVELRLKVSFIQGKSMGQITNVIAEEVRKYFAPATSDSNNNTICSKCTFRYLEDWMPKSIRQCCCQGGHH